MLSSLGLGGAERQAFLLARHLAHVEGADVRFVSFSRYAAMTPACDAASLPYEFYTLRHRYRDRVGQVRDLVRFVAFLRRRRPQILLPYCMFQNVLCGLSWRPGGARVCVWNQRDEGRSRLAFPLERLATRLTPVFVANSDHGGAFLTDVLRVPTSRVQIVANGIELPRPGPSELPWRLRLQIPSGSPMACMVANLHAKKDHTTLLAAWRQVVDRSGGGAAAPHLLLAGAYADQYEPLRTLAADLRLSEHVHFLGPVSEVDDLLRAVDFAVFSSSAEGLPNAVLEAMSHGVAVVATDYPGIRAAVGPAGFALLAPPRDATGLADRIQLALDDAPLRARLGRMGRERVADVFGLGRMTARLTSIIAAEWIRARG